MVIAILIKIFLSVMSSGYPGTISILYSLVIVLVDHIGWLISQCIYFQSQLVFCPEKIIVHVVCLSFRRDAALVLSLFVVVVVVVVILSIVFL